MDILIWIIVGIAVLLFVSWIGSYKSPMCDDDVYPSPLQEYKKKVFAETEKQAETQGDMFALNWHLKRLGKHKINNLMTNMYNSKQPPEDVGKMLISSSWSDVMNYYPGGLDKFTKDHLEISRPIQEEHKCSTFKEHVLNYYQSLVDQKELPAHSDMALLWVIENLGQHQIDETIDVLYGDNMPTTTSAHMLSECVWDAVEECYPGGRNEFNKYIEMTIKGSR